MQVPAIVQTLGFDCLRKGPLHTYSLVEIIFKIINSFIITGLFLKIKCPQYLQRFYKCPSYLPLCYVYLGFCSRRNLVETGLRTSEMTLQVNVPATKTEDVGSIPRAHKVCVCVCAVFLKM